MIFKPFFSRLLIALLFLIPVAIIVDRLIPGVSLADFSFLRTTRESAYTIAEEVDDLYLLNTSEYRIRLLFPYDFVDRDVDWWKVKEIYETGRNPGFDMSRELAVYKSCLNAGLDPAVDLYDFIVLTAVVRAGINIGDTVFENSSPHDKSGLNDYIKIESGEKGDIISLKIPDMEITGYYIEDRKPENDNFPDAELTPGQWRDLADFLSPLILEKVVSLGILENAGENTRRMIGKILKENGFSEVYFTGMDS